MNIVFLGPPGAGKGTQAVRVSARLRAVHISTGDMFRSAIKNETQVGLQAKKFIDAGALVPDEVTCAMVRERLAMPDAKGGYLLDGFPRTVLQAQQLELITKLNAVVNITVADEKLIKRLSNRRMCGGCGHIGQTDKLVDCKCPKCGAEVYQRDDDKAEAIANRLSVYHAQTQPLEDFYRERGLLLEVDGSGDVEDVERAIIKVLEATP